MPMLEALFGVIVILFVWVLARIVWAIPKADDIGESVERVTNNYVYVRADDTEEIDCEAVGLAEAYLRDKNL